MLRQSNKLVHQIYKLQSKSQIFDRYIVSFLTLFVNLAYA